MGHGRFDRTPRGLLHPCGLSESAPRRCSPPGSLASAFGGVYAAAPVCRRSVARTYELHAVVQKRFGTPLFFLLSCCLLSFCRFKNLFCKASSVDVAIRFACGTLM